MMVASKGTTSAVNRETIDWDSIDFSKHEQIVSRLQARIVKAEKAGKHNRVKALQRLLTRSFSGKAIAVRRVIATRGRILSLLRRAQARMQPGILLPVSYRNMRWE